MRKNGPLALIFHALVILFVLAPLAIVVLVRLHARRDTDAAHARLLAALVPRDP
jgi:hypothetical protein